MEINPENLIIEIKKRRALYDTSCEEYSDRNLKKQLWEEVCRKLITDWDGLEIQMKIKYGKEIQKRWSSLRDCFRREILLQKKMPSGSSAKHRKKYIYFDQMLFLLPYTKVPTNKSSLSLTENISEQSHHTDETGPYKTEPCETGPCETAPRRKKQKKNYDEEIIEILQEGNKQSSASELIKLLAEENKKKFDDDESFLLSLVPTFKKYDENEKLLLRIEIMNTIVRFNRLHKSKNIINIPTTHPNEYFAVQPSTSTGVYNFPSQQTSEWFGRNSPSTTASSASSIRHIKEETVISLESASQDSDQSA